MELLEPQQQQRIHFIGVGGVSMSALAHALADRGYQVSGSDRGDSARLDELRAAGLQIWVGHEASHVEGAGVVVYNTAIRVDNPERAAAMAAGLPLYHRSEMLAWMLRGHMGLAVTGTHGKTTTSAMLAWIFEQAGRDPVAFIGGDVNNWQTNYRLGAGKDIIFEACESDASFLAYKGCREIISSIEQDHLDQHNNIEKLMEAFAEFLRLADPDGFVVWGADCERTRSIIGQSPARTISFGLCRDADYSACDLQLNGATCDFELLRKGQAAGRFALIVPGQHNVLNALAAIAAAEASGIALDDCRRALGTFKGTGRRFELLGQCDNIRVYDDYAHHPTEIRATLAAARHFDAQRIVAIFQPHLYSRTRDLMEEFARAFGDADLVIINDIYAAREDPIPGVSAEKLVRKISALSNGKPVSFIADKTAIIEHVAGLAQPGDLILTIGAGDIREAGQALAKRVCCS